MPLALTDYEGTLDWIDDTVARGRGGYVCVASTHLVMATAEDPELRAAVLGSDFTVPDGQPLVWALNLLGHPLDDRVYGPDLMERACERAARTGRRMYLYGGRTHGALVQLTRNLRLRHPGAQDRRRLRAALPPPHGGRGEGRRGRHRALRRRGRVARHRSPEAGEVDGRDDRPAAGLRARRRRRRVRLPRRPRSRRLRGGCSGTGSSGCSGSRTSLAGCGGATCATTRASWSASPASGRGSACSAAIREPRPGHGRRRHDRGRGGAAAARRPGLRDPRLRPAPGAGLDARGRRGPHRRPAGARRGAARDPRLHARHPPGRRRRAVHAGGGRPRPPAGGGRRGRRALHLRVVERGGRAAPAVPRTTSSACRSPSAGPSASGPARRRIPTTSPTAW